MTLSMKLVDEAQRIVEATTLDVASNAYFTARAEFYSVLDADATTDGDRFAWSVVLDCFDEALERFATPVTPLVVFG